MQLCLFCNHSVNIAPISMRNLQEWHCSKCSAVYSVDISPSIIPNFNNSKPNPNAPIIYASVLLDDSLNLCFHNSSNAPYSLYPVPRFLFSFVNNSYVLRNIVMKQNVFTPIPAVESINTAFIKIKKLAPFF